MKIFIVLLIVANNCLAETCEDYYLRKLDNVSSLSLRDFQQEFSKEFKIEVSNENYCYREKVQLMEDYYYTNEFSQEFLKQHLADGWGYVGDYEKAIEWSQKQINGEKSTPWNNYILARIAFFKKDEDLFVKHYNLINDDPKYKFSNALYIVWLETLFENFDKPFRYNVENTERDVENKTKRKK